jgi:hypothetical protein
VTSCSWPASAQFYTAPLTFSSLDPPASAGCLSCLDDLVPDSGAVKTQFRPLNFLVVLLGEKNEAQVISAVLIILFLIVFFIVNIRMFISYFSLFI